MLIAPYLRVSTHEQAVNGNSIPEQKERLAKYCEARGWNVYDFYIDPGYSGSNTDRPELQRLIADAKAHRINAVLVYKLDRLSRSQKDTLNLIESVFLPNNVDFISISENFDTSTPFGRAMIGILAVFAQLEREQIKERMMMGKEARVKKGLYHGGGHPPYGYEYVNGQIIVKPGEAQTVKRIFDLAAAGNGPLKIRAALDADGLTFNGSEWSEYTIRYMLQNVTYIGKMPFKGATFQGTHEPIIDPAVFETVQRLVMERRENSNHPLRPGKASSYLSGLLYCTKCGRRYYKNSIVDRHYTPPRKREYYSCAARIARTACENRNWKMADLDNLIFDQIRALKLVTPDRQPVTPDDPVKPLETELKKLSAQLDRLLDLYALGGMPIDALQPKIAQLETQRRKLEERIAVLQTADPAPDPAALQKRVESFEDVLANGTFDEIRAVLFELIDRIDLDGDSVTIHWRF